jgi:curved DNA-binding protein CbpA
MTTAEAILILELSPPFTRKELKRAYHEALMVWHPDRFPGNESLRLKAEQKTYLLNDAYRQLSLISDSCHPFEKTSAGHDPHSAVPPVRPKAKTTQRKESSDGADKAAKSASNSADSSSCSASSNADERPRAQGKPSASNAEPKTQTAKSSATNGSVSANANATQPSEQHEGSEQNTQKQHTASWETGGVLIFTIFAVSTLLYVLIDRPSNQSLNSKPGTPHFSLPPLPASSSTPPGLAIPSHVTSSSSGASQYENLTGFKREIEERIRKKDAEFEMLQRWYKKGVRTGEKAAYERALSSCREEEQILANMIVEYNRRKAAANP